MFRDFHVKMGLDKSFLLVKEDILLTSKPFSGIEVSMQHHNTFKNAFFLISICLLFTTGFYGCASMTVPSKSTGQKTALLENQTTTVISPVQKPAGSPQHPVMAEQKTEALLPSAVSPGKTASVEKKTAGWCASSYDKTLSPTTNTAPPEEKKPLFDIPIVMNPRVENFVKFYQSTGRKQFSIWLARSERYIPMMRKVLKEHGLPTDLVYLAMIESGFNPRAYSRSRASGPWQFISGTGKKYGLKVNYWVDERRDPEKSTVAAARYLKDLYDQFDSWHLAAAAYNCGEGKMARAIKRYNTEDFWKLSRHRYLKKETRLYVPQIIAAAIIAKEPEKYGFNNIQYQEPLAYEGLPVPGGVTLKNIARASGCSEQLLRELNPELTRRCTPPYSKHYTIKVPKGARQILAINMNKLKPVVKISDAGWVRTHRIRRGDTLYGLSLKYRVRVRDIKYLNNIRGNLLHVGHRLLIPAGKIRHHKTRRKFAASHRNKSRHLRGRKVASRRPRSRYKEIVYVVRRGDNLWTIARSFNIHVEDICSLNPHISKRTLLHPSDKLKLRVLSTELTRILKPANAIIQ